MYKDKQKQKEANKAAAQRQRDKKGRVLEEIEINVIPENIIPSVIPEQGITERVLPDKPKRGKDIKCFEDLPPDVQRTIEMLSDSEEEKQRRTGIAIHYQHIFPGEYEPNSGEAFTKLMATLSANSPNYPVSKPSDTDYVPMCETTKKWVKEQLACIRE